MFESPVVAKLREVLLPRVYYKYKQTNVQT